MAEIKIEFNDAGNSTYASISNYYNPANNYTHLSLNNAIQNDAQVTSESPSYNHWTENFANSGKKEIRIAVPIDSRSAEQGYFGINGPGTARDWYFIIQNDVANQHHTLYDDYSNTVVELPDANIPYAQGTVVEIMLAFNFDTGEMWAGINGVWYGDPEAGTGASYSNLTNYTGAEWRARNWWFSDQVGDKYWIKSTPEYDSTTLTGFDQLTSFNWEGADAALPHALDSVVIVDLDSHYSTISFSNFFSEVGRFFGEFSQGGEPARTYKGSASVSSTSTGYKMKKNGTPSAIRWRLRERKTMTIVRRGMSNADGEWIINGLNPNFYYRIEIEDDTGTYNAASLDWMQPQVQT